MSVRGVKYSLRASLRLLVVFSAGMAGCTEAQIEALLFPGEGEVLGRVVDAGGAGVAGIPVSTSGGGNTTTDANGVFTIRPVHAGSSVEVRLDLHLTDYWSPDGGRQNVQVLGGETARVPPFTIRRYASVRGFARLAVPGGTPLSGVNVQCARTEQNNQADNCFPDAVTTGADGAYVLRLKAGPFTLTPAVQDMWLVNGREFEAVTVADGETRMVDLILDGVGTVEVRVMKEDGFWADVTVTMAGHGSQDTSIGVTTFQRVIHGQRRISITVPPGYVMAPNHTAQRTITVATGETQEVFFLLREAIGGIRGRVTTVAGEGVGDVLIRHSSGIERRTSAQGNYGMPVESEGSHTVTITPPDGWEVVPPGTPVRTTTVTFAANSTVDWVIRPIASGTGTVVVHVTEGGRPMAGVSVALEGLNMTGVTTANGDIVFNNVPAGTHNARITPPDGWEIDLDEPSVKVVTVTGGGTSQVSWVLCEIEDGTTPGGGRDGAPPLGAGSAPGRGAQPAQGGRMGAPLPRSMGAPRPPQR